MTGVRLWWPISGPRLWCTITHVRLWCTITGCRSRAVGVREADRVASLCVRMPRRNSGAGGVRVQLGYPREGQGELARIHGATGRTAGSGKQPADERHTAENSRQATVHTKMPPTTVHTKMPPITVHTKMPPTTVHIQVPPTTVHTT